MRPCRLKKYDILFQPQSSMEMIHLKTREVANQYRMAQWGERIREQKLSGKTIKEWCAAQGISVQKYYYWQRKIRSTVCEQIGKEPDKQGTSLVTTSFVEVKLEQPESVLPKGGVLQIEAGGIRITTDSAYPVEKLAELLLGVARP